jgi:two-component system, OmpR family, alkaline phosphatase synthesis response regulator PhoP
MVQRILVVDNNPQIVRLVSSCLEEAGFVTLMAYNSDGALGAVRREPLDLVVLDVTLPGQNGLDITRWLRADPHMAGVPVLMLTPGVEDLDQVLGLEMGLDDFLTKPFNLRDLMARVRAILRRTVSGPHPPPILQIGSLRLDMDHHFLSVEGQAIELTPTEFSVLQTLMRNPDHAFTRSQLIEQALGYSYNGQERTLDTHIKNLRKKIERNPAEPRYLKTVFGVGYRLGRQGP